MRNLQLVSGGCALLFALAVNSPASAVLYTASGFDPANEAVSASADITLGAGTITIVLKNLQQNPISAGQLVNGVQFDATGASSSGNLTRTASGLVTTINISNDTYSAGVSDLLTRWKGTETGSTIKLTTLSGGNPDRLIIGPDSKGNFDPTLGGLYTNANNSILGDNPSILGTATFVLTVAGITSNSVLSNVRILFGTSSDYQVASCGPPGTDCAAPPPGETPVPGAAFLMGSVLAGGAGFGAWRRRRPNKFAA
jgi:hypothetical protein